MKPIIGITPSYDNIRGITGISPFYAKAIEDMGGIPFILPYSEDPAIIEQTALSLNGIIFSGGTNVDPYKYGEVPTPQCGEIEFERDIFELALCKAATEKDIPILGICRGCQLITVAAGGTLCQNIENHFQSSDKHMSSHSIKIIPDTPLYEILKADTASVNSFHRQCVKTAGGLKIAATDENGVIEAVYMPGKKYHLGVQWHPERMYAFNQHARLILQSFISSCC